MTVVRLKGLKVYTHPKTGIVYRYHRATGTRLVSEPGTPEFLAEFTAIDAKAKAPQPPAAPGTLGRLIKAYRASHQFLELKPRTRADYEKVITYLASMDGLPLASIDGPFVAKLRDKIYAQRKRRFANYCLAVLSVMLEFGRERGDVKDNATRGVKKIRRRDDAPTVNRAWTAAERDTVMAAAPAQLLLPIAIARWTGLRQGDILRMPPTAYDGASIRIRTSKRGVLANIPVAAPLKTVIAATRPAEGQSQPLTLCATSRGTPWTSSGFRASFFKLIGSLEAKGEIGSGLTFHGLRHSAATELRELGFDSRTIADMLAQKTTTMAEHYSSEADLSAKLKGVVQRMERAESKRTRANKT